MHSQQHHFLSTEILQELLFAIVYFIFLLSYWEKQANRMVAKMRMKAIYDCSADEPGELTFKEGDILVDVVKSTEEGWYEGRLENSTTRGLFPFNYVEPFPEQVTDTKPTISKVATPKTEDIQPDSLSNFPTLDAFEAAMSQTRKGASSNNNTIQNHKIKQPVTTASPIATTATIATATTTTPMTTTPMTTVPIKSSLPTNSKKEEPIGLGIKLKPTGLRQDIASRSRSYSTPTSPNTSDSPNSNFEKIIRPSQLRKDQGMQSTLSAALSKGPPSSSSSISSSSSGLRSSPKPENSSIPLVGLTAVKSIVTKGDTDDENDGEKLVKPSQLRNRNQFNKLETRSSPSVSIISSSPNTTWKKNSAPSGTTTTSTTTNKSPSSDKEKRMSVPEPNNPMPRLPSRPMSAATRKSRSSRTSSTNSASTATNNKNNNINNKNNITTSTTTTTSSSTSPTTTKVLSDSPKTAPHLLPASQENVSQVVEKSAPPALKPKPNVAQPFLPPRPNNKLRSTSNPPPLQPKPFTAPEKPTTSSTPSPPPPSQSNVVKKTIPVVEVKSSNSTTTHPPPPSSTATTTPPPIAAKPSSVALKQTPTAITVKSSPPPVNGLQKPVLPSRPSLDSWRENNNNNDNDENKNIKPSQLFNRARSATSPSSPSKPMDWNPANLIKSPESKKKTPPPPPPSRQPKNFQNHVMDSAAKVRYEQLFDEINDEGFVDGETILVIWKKSKLSNEDLAHVWNDCDPDHKGLLDKESFIEGLRKIDEILSKK